MKLYNYLFLASLLFLPHSLSSSIWNDSAGDDSWNNPTNWNSGVPDGAGSTAEFNSLGAPQAVDIAKIYCFSYTFLNDIFARF